jgi:HAD superfamily hydrolase (TIGR01490 family)
MKKETIAVFDFDGTITRKDTLIEFIKFTRGKRRFYGGFLLFSPLLIAMKLRLLPNWKVKQQLFSYFYIGISAWNFDKWGIEFSAMIDKILRPKTMEILKLHKKNGNKTIIISASIENWIKPWAAKTGIDMVLSTQIEIDSNRLLTGKFLTKNCYGQEKVKRLLEMFPNRSNYKLVVYGNSRGDRELIDFADEGYYKFK